MLEGLQNKNIYKYNQLNIDVKTYGDSSIVLFSLFKDSLSTVQSSSLIKSHSKGSNGVLNSKSKYK